MKKLVVKAIIIFTLALIGCNGIEKETVNLVDIISLTVLDKDKNELNEYSVLGDGETIVILRAEIPKNTNKNFKSITFHKSAGDFVEVSNTDGKITADSEGVAEIKLKVPLDDTEIFVSAQASNGEEIFIDEVKINLENVGDVIDLSFLDINNSVLNEIPRADGVSILKLKGDILFNKNALNSITFEATEGLFQAKNEKTETKNTNSNGEAIVNYVVPQTPGTVFYSAKVSTSDKYIDTSELTFQSANADKLIIEPTLVLMDTINANTIKVFLSRETGKVSLGTKVKFKAFQIDNAQEKEIGRFTGTNEAKSNADGLVTASFLADTQDFEKELPIYIRASTTKDDDSVLSEEIQIKIKTE